MNETTEKLLVEIAKTMQAILLCHLPSHIDIHNPYATGKCANDMFHRLKIATEAKTRELETRKRLQKGESNLEPKNSCVPSHWNLATFWRWIRGNRIIK